jgi:hypothetical protein
MKFSDKFFRFPVKLYMSKDIEERNRREENLGLEIEDEPEYLIGWDCVDVNDIRGYGTIFSKGRTMADVKESGFDCTVIYLNYGREIGCAWSPEKFQMKLNQFVDKIEEDKRKDRENDAKIQATAIKIELEKAIRELPSPDIEDKIDLDEPPREGILKRIWRKLRGK